MRVSTNMIYDQGVRALQTQSAALLHTGQQIATGRKILTPSDDPVASARALDVTQSSSVNMNGMSRRLHDLMIDLEGYTLHTGAERVLPFLLREAANRGLRQHFSPPVDHVTLAVPLAVEPGSVFAGRPLERESLLVLRPEEEYDLVSAGELEVLGLSVHQALLDGLAPAKVEWLRQAQDERNLPLAPEVATAIRHMLLAVSADAEREIDSLTEGAAEADLLTSTLTQTVILAMTCFRDGLYSSN